MKEYRRVMLFLSYLCMLGFAFTLQSIPPVLPLIIKGLKLSHTQAGVLMGIYSLPAIFLSIPAGMLSDRFGPFRIGIASLSFIIIGNAVFTLADTFLIASIGRAVAGLGAAVIVIIAAHMLSQWYGDREIGTAMGIFNTAMPVGTIICFTLFGRLGEALGWRFPFYITICISSIALIAFIFLYKSAPVTSDAGPIGQDTQKKISKDNEDKPVGIFSKIIQLKATMWLVGLCWMWFNIAVISFSTFAPDFFVAKGYKLGRAGFLVSLLMWGSLGISPIIGRLVDRVNKREFFIGTGGVLISTAILIVSGVDHVLYPMILMAIAVALVPAPVFSYPPRILNKGNLGLGFGVLNMVSNIGMFLGPSAAGAVRDVTGSYVTSFLFLAGIAFLVTVTAWILHMIKGRLNTD
jgi:predicted MFS family arabinose efflux permease